MIIVLSPAKSLDYETPPHVKKHTLPEFIDDAAELIDGLRRLVAAADRQPDATSPTSSRSSTSSATPTGRRSFGTHNAKQAVLAFNGDVYEGFDAKTLSAARPRLRAESRARAVRPVRLAASARSAAAVPAGNGHAIRQCPRGKDLYAFWGERITAALNAQLKKKRGARVLVNCASEEYFKSVKPKLLDAPVITPVFEDWKGGRYKIISFHAKRARGLMARYVVENRIDEPLSS